MALQRDGSGPALLDSAHVVARQAQLGPPLLIALSFSPRSNLTREFLQVETTIQSPWVYFGLALGSGRLRSVQPNHLYSAAFLLQQAQQKGSSAVPVSHISPVVTAVPFRLFSRVQC